MMHHIRHWSWASAATAVLVLTSLPAGGQANESSDPPPPPDQITFFCRDIYDRASGDTIPATLVWIPERQGNIRLIGWKSEFFSKYGWTPEKRCEVVTDRFAKFHKDGQLKFLTTGYVKGLPIVCGLAQENEVCDGSKQLFTIKPHDNPSQVLKQLIDIVRGKSGDILLQNSGGNTLVPVPELFKKAPVTDQEPPICRKSAGPQAEPDQESPDDIRSAGPQVYCPNSRTP